MLKKLSCFILIAFVLSLLPIGVSAEEAPSMKELYSFKFDDENTPGATLSFGVSVEAQWASASGVGHEDDAALKLSHIDGMAYTSSDNAIRITFDEPLPVGGVYNVSVWFFVPVEGNDSQDKGKLKGPGFVINGEYGGNLGETKFPKNIDKTSMPLGEWKEVNITLPIAVTEITSFDFRFYANEFKDHPDVWYIDNITISLVGEVDEGIRIPKWDLGLTSLKDTFSDYFMFGNVMNPKQTTDTETTAMFLNQYNVVTPENCMKPDTLTKAKDVYNFDDADTFVDWAQANGLAIHGHTLVWHSQSATWLTTGKDNKPLTRAEARTNMENYINKVAGRYAGRIHSWDVVNEAVNNSVHSIPTDWRSELRAATGDTSPWYKAYANGADADKGESGGDYIYDAFVFARIADPNAILYYNDYNETEPGKCATIAMMVEALNEQWKSDERNTQPGRLLIEGIGMQAHYWTDTIKAEEVDATIKRYAETGALVSVSELDIPFGTYSTYRIRKEEPNEEELKVQADLYRQMFEVYLKYAENIERVTIWGKSDSQSWRGEGYPLLFNGYFEAKPAFYSVIEAGAAAEKPAQIDQSSVDELTAQEPDEVTVSDENGSADDIAGAAGKENSGANEESGEASVSASADEDGGTNVALIVVIVVVAVLVVGGAAAFVLKRKSKKA